MFIEHLLWARHCASWRDMRSGKNEIAKQLLEDFKASLPRVEAGDQEQRCPLVLVRNVPPQTFDRTPQQNKWRGHGLCGDTGWQEGLWEVEEGPWHMAGPRTGCRRGRRG